MAGSTTKSMYANSGSGSIRPVSGASHSTIDFQYRLRTTGGTPSRRHPRMAASDRSDGSIASRLSHRLITARSIDCVRILACSSSIRAFSFDMRISSNCVCTALTHRCRAKLMGATLPGTRLTRDRCGVAFRGSFIEADRNRFWRGDRPLGFRSSLLIDAGVAAAPAAAPGRSGLSIDELSEEDAPSERLGLTDVPLGLDSPGLPLPRFFSFALLIRFSTEAEKSHIPA
mmetsp:Transcript_3703/g.11621  ORF Transcript_3703/g.11621 Transcript_3703/m.11621 type:complete len:229 (-) Transcript_3703:1044-1730(-)